MNKYLLVLATILVSATWAGDTEKEAKTFIDEVYKHIAELDVKLMSTQWAANTADKAHSKTKKKEYDEATDNFYGYEKEIYTKLMSFPWKSFSDSDVQRKFFLLSSLDERVLPDDKKARFEKIQEEINQIRDSAQVKKFQSSDNTPTLKSVDVDKIVNENYMNADLIDFYWKEIHDAASKPTKGLFTEWVTLENEIAHLNGGYHNAKKFWQDDYEIDDFDNTMHRLYEEIKPFYQELHAYIRHKMREVYGNNDAIIDDQGPIPNHLFGWKTSLSQSPLYDRLVPYRDLPSLDIAPKLKSKEYSAKKMAEVADNFFQSLGFSRLPESLYKNSIFEKRGDTECLPGFYDMHTGGDYRLIYCAQPTKDDFSMIHYYVGLAEYASELENLKPYFYKRAPNPAFENVIYDLANSANYHKSLGLLDSNVQLDKKQAINVLFREAMLNVFPLPFQYSYDLWRWDVFEGKIAPQKYNCEYWKIRTDIQGVEPPVDRDENDFDPGFEPWLAKKSQYIMRYIMAFLRYDIIKALCETNGYYNTKDKPDNFLVFCDVSHSSEVGKKLKAMMALGNSRPLNDVLKAITGHTHLDASGLLEYYKPLREWLHEENKKNKVTLGWPSKHNRCH